MIFEAGDKHVDEGRGGVVFKEYFFDAEEAHLAAAWLYEISLALAR